MYQKKLSEISKIKEKNKRIVKILQDLDLTEEVVKPELSIYEDPESLLTVEDHEVGNGRLGWWDGDRRKGFVVLVKDHEVGNGCLGWWEEDKRKGFIFLVGDQEVGNGRLGWWDGDRRKGLQVLAHCMLLDARDSEQGGKKGGGRGFD